MRRVAVKNLHSGPARSLEGFKRFKQCKSSTCVHGSAWPSLGSKREVLQTHTVGGMLAEISECLQ